MHAFCCGSASGKIGAQGLSLARDTAVMEALVEAERPGAPTPQPATSVSLLPPPASCVCSSSSCAASAAGACPLVPPSALHAAATRAALRSLAADKQTRAIVRAPSAATHAAVPLLPRRRPSSLGVPAHLPVCCRSAAQRPPEGTVLANSCRYVHDGECDEPADGTGKCAAGTDRNDCEAMNSCPYARDGRNRFRGGARVFAGPALTATTAVRPTRTPQLTAAARATSTSCRTGTGQARRPPVCPCHLHGPITTPILSGALR